MKEQLSLLGLPLPTGAAPAWNSLDAEQRALAVSTLARVMAKAAVVGDDADEENGDE